MEKKQACSCSSYWYTDRRPPSSAIDPFSRRHLALRGADSFVLRFLDVGFLTSGRTGEPKTESTHHTHTHAFLRILMFRDRDTCTCEYFCTLCQPSRSLSTTSYSSY